MTNEIEAEFWQAVLKFIFFILIPAAIMLVVEFAAILFPSVAKTLNESDDIRKCKPSKTVSEDYLHYCEEELRKNKKFIGGKGNGGGKAEEG